MYGYEQTPSTIGELLETYSQEDIFTIVFGSYPDPSILYLSPFRQDNNPNCFFEWYKGKLYFRDYADIARDCLHAVKDFYSLDSYSDVMKVVTNHFSLHPIPQDQKPVKFSQKDKKDCSVTFRIREWEKRDSLVWDQYEITREQLTEDHVSVISMYRFYSEKSNRWVILRPFDPAYAISGFGQKCKIYRPLNHCRQSKWLTNCSSDDVGNLWGIDYTGDLLIITKSYKDYRCIKNQGYKNVIWIQSEKVIPSDKILFDLLSRYERVLIFYDNDLIGMTGAGDLQTKLETLNPAIAVRSIHSPYSYMKDPAEMVSIRGGNELKEFLKKYT